MSKQHKSNYNRTYYSKHKDKILQRAKNRTQLKSGSGFNIFPLFQGEDSTGPSNRIDKKLRRPSFEILMLTILVLAMTFFLVTESARFYLSTEGSSAEAYLKALILEGAGVAFSIMRARTWLLGVAYKLMVAAIYAYSVWVVSGSVIHTAIRTQQEVGINQKVAQELEEQILKMESTRDEFWKMRRITLAREYDLALADLRKQLDQARVSIVHLPGSVVIWNTFATLVCFRILVMVSNFFCLQHLGQKHRAWTRVG